MGALTLGLSQSELFGSVRGSYTGAHIDRAGLFEAANGGTILLDEIGDAPPHIQVELLRILETKEVRRLGATHATRLDFRSSRRPINHLSTISQKVLFAPTFTIVCKVLRSLCLPSRKPSWIFCRWLKSSCAKSILDARLFKRCERASNGL